MLLLESCEMKSVFVLRWSSHHIRKPVWGYLWIHLLKYWLDEVFSHFCWDLGWAVGFLMSIGVFNEGLISVMAVDQHTSTHWCPRTSLSTSPIPHVCSQLSCIDLTLIILILILVLLLSFPGFQDLMKMLLPSVAPWEVFASLKFILLPYSTDIQSIDWRLDTQHPILLYCWEFNISHW